MTEYVTCPVTVSSPAPDDRFLALGGKPNMVCGQRCEVVRLSPYMEFRCQLGHHFQATPSDVKSDDSGRTDG